MGNKLALVILLITTLVVLSSCATTRSGRRSPRYTTCAWCSEKCYETKDMGLGAMSENAYLRQLRTGAISDGQYVFCSLRCKNLASRDIEEEKHRYVTEEEHTWSYED